jgi:hypothetical protein
MACATRRSFHRVTIKPSGDDLGHVLFKRWDKTIRPDIDVSPRVRERIEAAVHSAMAGHAAEAIHTGRNNWVGSTSDRTTALDLLGYLTGSDEELAAYWKLMWIRTRQRLRCDWKCVEALAAALLERETLTYAQAKATIDDARFPAAERERVAAIARAATR